MSVGLVIVTHGQIGQSLVDSAAFVLDRSLAEIRCIGVTQSGSEWPDQQLIRDAIQEADSGEGVLVMTDLGCASPSNTVEKQVHGLEARVVSGVNLPMLLRAWNYREHPLDELARRAVEGGLKGIGLRGA
ncbi:MAG: PTS sugar transporter subunit IIA [Xanthomonadales bacterium]|nr:PTS sugar transporter subunit IIA [Xanthomonadales bacterium]